MNRRLPGERLRALASRLCSDIAMERLIDPVLADLQREDADAARRGQVWHRRGIRIAGTLAFWKVIGLHAVTRAPALAREWAAADEHAVGRTVAFAATFIAALTLLFVWQPLSSTVIQRDHLGYYTKFSGHDLAWLVLYMVPQAVAVGVPLGFSCGVLCGLRRRTVTARARRAILLIAISCSALSLPWPRSWRSTATISPTSSTRAAARKIGTVSRMEVPAVVTSSMITTRSPSASRCPTSTPPSP